MVQSQTSFQGLAQDLALGDDPPSAGNKQLGGLGWESETVDEKDSTITSQRDGQKVRVQFSHPDVLIPPQLRTASRQFLDMVDQSSDCDVVIDLSNINFFLASEAVGMLIAAHSKLKRSGGKLHIEGATGHVREVFTVTRLDQLIEVAE